MQTKQNNWEEKGRRRYEKIKRKRNEKINEISTKYKFRDYFELEQDDIYNFCNTLLQCFVLGLSVESEDVAFITEVRDTLEEG